MKNSSISVKILRKENKGKSPSGFGTGGSIYDKLCGSGEMPKTETKKMQTGAIQAQTKFTKERIAPSVTKVNNPQHFTSKDSSGVQTAKEFDAKDKKLAKKKAKK